MKPILLDFPHEFYTDRLHIRMPHSGDGEAVYNAIQASLNELKPWMPFAHLEQTMEDVEVNIRNSHIKFLKREDLRLLVFLKDTGEFVASSGLHRMDWEVPKFEIGYWMDTRYSGKGYMTEAVQGITDFAFTELNARRLEIRCDPKNKRSCAVPERLGFILEGVLRNDDISLVNNELTDTCIYALIKQGDELIRG
ncbi:GNAT family N-acetyltransferase [Pseudalkalibacillus decolorationis]|uniref:GNAT family N-acetyltransferase n=1 Tax=Pseudalkalibacillus decolorationis TaxID=163879 RepID=UPI00214791E3|nr:GNAT family N-acetyltransferase [Pseudalkalibacillus decolorationis]